MVSRNTSSTMAYLISGQKYKRLENAGASSRSDFHCSYTGFYTLENRKLHLSNCDWLLFGEKLRIDLIGQRGSQRVADSDAFQTAFRMQNIKKIQCFVLPDTPVLLYFII